MAEEQRIWRRTWKPDVKSSPWIPLPVNDKQYWLKSHFQSDSMAVSVFDGVHVWSEVNTVEDITSKTKLYNPNVEAPVSKVLQHLKECLQFNSTKGQLQVRYKDQKLFLEVTSNLTGGVPFKWKFETKKESEETISDEVTFPLLCMVSELIQREKALVSILKRKDIEIDDMKAGGAKVSRKYLETTPFNHKGFQQERIQSKSFEELVSTQGMDCFNTEGQMLYKEIMVTSAWLDRPQPENNLAVEGAADTLPVAPDGGKDSPSWANKIPPSLLTQDAATSAGSSPAGSRNSSPRKVFSPGKLEEQQTELLRREALERKLEDEKQKLEAKPKRKKKKLF